jgi:hypothetical protein
MHPAMNSISISALIITILFGSAMVTMFVARFLPDHHLSLETKSVVSVSVAVVGTLSALVVGLLISTANSSFTAKGQEIADISADVISLDRLMQRYGPEAQDGRVLLRHYTAAKLQDLFPENSNQPPDLENIATVTMLEELQNKILTFIPANDRQTWLKAQSLQLTAAIMAARWQLAQGNTSTPKLLLLLVLLWFVIIFASFGLFAPRNVTAIVAILLCSFGVGSAIRIITELQEPFGGLIRVSSTPLTYALEVIGR